MTGAKRFAERIIPPDSWLESAVRHIRYGITIIRQDGMLYFIKRFFQLITWQANAIYQSIYIKLTSRGEARFVKVEDIHLSTQAQSPQMLDDRPPHNEALNTEQSSKLVTDAGYHNDLVMQGISCHNQYITERQTIIQQGHEAYSNRRVLFVSPIRVLGGGANLIFLAARTMQRMGVDVQIMNLRVHRSWFEKHYPGINLPVVFADMEEMPQLVADYDAVIATSNPTISWIAPVAGKHPHLVLGYYIQDYEPSFYAQGTHEFQRANVSYTLIPNLIRMVTTPWISDQIQLHHHVDSTIVGAHMDTDLFLPRPRANPSWPDRPLRITAMVRPTTARRNPKMTMAILQQASKMYGSKLEIRLFGCEPTDPGFAALDKDFPWQLAGQLRPTQVANLLNEADIFVDYSEYQAFGLTAIESMATGLAVIVPGEGGASFYAKHDKNSLVVDTHDQISCFNALQRLIEDDSLRLNLQVNAISTAARFFPELPTLTMLKALFSENT